MRLSEKKLLDGLQSLGTDGWSAVSVVEGRRIVWAYRKPKEGNFRLVTPNRDEADAISVEFPWRETLRLNKNLSIKQKRKAAQFASWATEWRPC